MTDIVGAIEKIQEEETEYKDPQGRLYDKIGSNINQLIDDAADKGFLGEVKSSILTESQFQSRRGTSWVIMIGQDITGSGYHLTYGVSTLPDMRGHFPRVWANDGSVDTGRVLGSVQADATLDHRHFITRVGPRTAALVASGSIGIQRSGSGLLGDSQAWLESGTDGDLGKTNTHGGTYGKPENYSVNYFIRINV